MKMSIGVEGGRILEEMSTMSVFTWKKFICLR